MSLLHRWSLPSRGFTRDNSQDEECSDQTKFPTIHIGQLGPRRRTELSSVFYTLFEKPENRRGVRKVDRSEADEGLPLLASRRENVPSDIDIDFKDSHIRERQDIISTSKTPSPQNSTVELASGNVEVGNTGSGLGLTLDISAQITQQIDETPKIRSFSLSSTETQEAGNPDEPTHNRERRMLSASSCYPSEGMRSPDSGYHSPESATAHTADHFAEYQCFGRYPSQSSWHPPSIYTSEVSSSNTIGGKAQAILASSDISHDRAVAGQDDNLGASPFADPPKYPTESTCSHSTQPQPRPTILHAIDSQHKPSSTSEVTVPVLADEDAMSSQLDVRFMSYKRPTAQSASDSSDGYKPGGRRAVSTDRPCVSADTDRTIILAAKRPSGSDEEDAWSTIREAGERPLARRASWMRFFTLAGPNDSSTSLAQRLQKLKLKKWAKRMCSETKAWFELMGRPAKSTGFQARRRNWRYKVKKMTVKRAKKVRKGLGKNKNKSKSKSKEKKRWSIGKTIEITKKRMIQHKETADHFFGTLAERKSVQFGTVRLEKEDKVPGTHKRAQSCPV
ncbi:hypothetical protein GQX73_g6051 [Xylaria multiplex]|uniref:Uncharacterized protein n=1 Tax=Xylaria multiplex TaxID=323545 RepID=A0A7C8IR03_9PEZI|nr:hypothetical protein GQX73_g6051 [Xylaria multiplex]